VPLPTGSTIRFRRVLLPPLRGGHAHLPGEAAGRGLLPHRDDRPPLHVGRSAAPGRGAARRTGLGLRALVDEGRLGGVVTPGWLWATGGGGRLLCSIPERLSRGSRSPPPSARGREVSTRRPTRRARPGPAAGRDRAADAAGARW